MEVSKIFSRKSTQIGLLFILFVSLYSCGTYQSAYNYDDDGIYTTNNQQDEDEIIIVDKSEFDKSYFSRQLEEIQYVGEEDIFTDIDDYYYDDTYENESSDVDNYQPCAQQLLLANFL